MSDMGAVITPKSDQWNYDDFLAGPLTFTIRGVSVKAGQEQPVQISVEGSNKFYRPCKSMARVFVTAWGPDSSKYVGRSLTLYGDPSVKWGGMEVGGIRISHMSDIESNITMALTMTKGSRKPYTVRPLERMADEPCITPEQVASIETRCQDNGIAIDKLKDALKVTALAMIPASLYASVNKRIDATIAARKQAA